MKQLLPFILILSSLSILADGNCSERHFDYRTLENQMVNPVVDVLERPDAGLTDRERLSLLIARAQSRGSTLTTRTIVFAKSQLKITQQQFLGFIDYSMLESEPVDQILVKEREDGSVNHPYGPNLNEIAESFKALASSAKDVKQVSEKVYEVTDEDNNSYVLDLRTNLFGNPVYSVNSDGEVSHVTGFGI